MCLWSVRWWFSPDLDLLLERDAAEEERLDMLEEEEKLRERERLVRRPASMCMAWWSFFWPPLDR